MSAQKLRVRQSGSAWLVEEWREDPDWVIFTWDEVGGPFATRQAAEAYLRNLEAT